MKKTAGATDCFRFVSLPLICWSSSGQTVTLGRLPAHRWEITMSRCKQCPVFHSRTICRHLIVVAAKFVLHTIEVVQPLCVLKCTGFCFPFFSRRPFQFFDTSLRSSLGS